MIRVWAETAYKLRERSNETGVPTTRLLDDLVNEKTEQPKKQQTLPVEELPKDENDCIARGWKRKHKFTERGEEYIVFTKGDRDITIKTGEREL